ncbi:hypothetical protein A2U01_0073283, partial [Trifolium medium]|nr:hypothetical protein [Trifolium medium]
VKASQDAMLSIMEKHLGKRTGEVEAISSKPNEGLTNATPLKGSTSVATNTKPLH